MLTLVHFSAQSDSFLSLMMPHSQTACPTKVLRFSRKLDESKPLVGTVGHFSPRHRVLLKIGQAVENCSVIMHNSTKMNFSHLSGSLSFNIDITQRT